jgi:hypothetical protein
MRVLAKEWQKNKYNLFLAVRGNIFPFFAAKRQVIIGSQQHL